MYVLRNTNIHIYTCLHISRSIYLFTFAHRNTQHICMRDMHKYVYILQHRLLVSVLGNIEKQFGPFAPCAAASQDDPERNEDVVVVLSCYNETKASGNEGSWLSGYSARRQIPSQCLGT